MSLYKPGRPAKYEPNTGKGKEPPSKPGEYRIRDDETGEILYVGEACNLKRRMQQHKRNGRFD